MMTSSDLVKADESFPVLTGDIVQDTETIVGELAVGAYVVERGMARLYIVWKTKLFLNLTTARFTCTSCGFVYREFVWIVRADSMFVKYVTKLLQEYYSARNVV